MQGAAKLRDVQRVVTPAHLHPRTESKVQRPTQARIPFAPAGVNRSRAGNLFLVSWVPHLTKADIRRYIAGAGSVGADRHVRICPYCSLRVAAAATDAVWWERRGPLGRLVRVDVSQVDELLAEIAEEQRHDAG
jgi:hypothetical protein